MGTTSTQYDQDFYAWTQEQAALLREGAVHELDLTNLAEELESLGKSEKRDLESRLEALVLHLLKWQEQPLMRLTGHSWASTIVEQRHQIPRILRDNPSLRPQLPAILDDVYASARARAILEMGSASMLPPRKLLRLSRVPSTCPWPIEHVLDPDFWPGLG